MNSDRPLLAVLLGLLLLCAATSVHAAAPVNDNFTNRLDLGSALPQITTNSNVCATLEPLEISDFGLVDNHTVWFRWTLPVNGFVEVNTIGANFDAAVAVFLASAGFPQLSDLVTSDYGRVIFPATAGQEFSFLVFSAVTNSSGTFPLSIALAPTPYDNYSNRLNFGSNVIAEADLDNRGATVQSNEFLFSTNLQSTIWAVWTAPFSGLVRVDTTNAVPTTNGLLPVLDTRMAVFTDNGSLPTNGGSFPLAQNNDAPGSVGSEVTFIATSGLTYIIQVGGNDSAQGRLRLRVEQLFSPPFNDDVANALSLGSTASNVIGGSNLGATLEPGEHLPLPQMQATVWYSWVAPTNDYFQFDAQVFGSVDTVLAVYGGASPSASNLVGFTDDGVVVIPAIAGQTNLIQVGGYNVTRGNFNLGVTLALPPNDDYFTSIQLPDVVEFHTNGWNLRATTQANEYLPRVGMDATVWYLWTAPQSGTYTLDTLGVGEFDTILAVYQVATGGPSSVPSASALIAFNDDAPSSLASRVSFAAVAGQTYAFQVAGFSALYQGTFPLNLLPPPPDIAVASFDGLTLTNGAVVNVDTVSSTSRTLVFPISNVGSGFVSNLSISVSGTNAAEFAVTVPPPTNLTAFASNNFTIVFTPAVNESLRTATLTLLSSDPDESPFTLTLRGYALGYANDQDGDGLNDGSEFLLRSLGFDHRVAQPALVGALYSGAASAGLFTTNQVQALNIGAPLIQRDPTTGQMTLTIGLKKSTNLVSYPPFPFVFTNTTVNCAGELEFRFAAPENAAFFRLESR